MYCCYIGVGVNNQRDKRKCMHVYALLVLLSVRFANPSPMKLNYEWQHETLSDMF
jgi:hypothetical protein